MYSVSAPFTIMFRRKLCFSKVKRRKQSSAWLNPSQKEDKIANIEGSELEHLFVDQRVQTLLRALTGFNLEKFHPWKITSLDNRKHYALMTDGMHKEFISNLSKRTQPFLQFVPMKEPRSNKAEILATNPEISGHDSYNIIFTDISYDATKIDRTIVVREPNGRLRKALPEEHYRMHRIYYDKSNRPVKEPPLFSFYKKDGISFPGDALKQALSSNEHAFVLDWACYLYEPDHPQFIELCKCIFEWTIREAKLDILLSTRHFGPLAIYMLINGQINELLNFYSSKGSISDAANTIRLYRLMYPDWKTTISFGDSDNKVVQDFLDAIEKHSNTMENEADKPENLFSQKLQPLRNLLLKSTKLN